MPDRMSDYEAIRPYRDDEVPEVLARVLANDRFTRAVTRLFAPTLAQWCPPVARALVRRQIHERLSGCHTVRDVQMLVADGLEYLVANTTHGLTSGGAEALPEGPILFVGNHRDIALDSSFLNLVLHEHGRDTCRIAVGDNLLTEDYVSDLIRVNKGFVVPRETGGAKETLRALSTTSGFIRESLQANQSVWIAQAPGRAKDGCDRTEPALLKMLMLAYRKECETVAAYLERVVLVPLTVSYELDPCDVSKAQEVEAVDRLGAYEKSHGEDLKNLSLGISGQKGRVHLQFGERVQGDFEDADALAAEMDRRIASGAKVYATHAHAMSCLGEPVPSALSQPDNTAAVAILKQTLSQSAPALRPYLLNQYANVARAAIAAGC